MNDLVNETIDKYYRNNNESDYLPKCREQFVIPEAIKKFSENNNMIITDVNFGEIWPSSKLIFEYEDYTKGEFEVTYSTILMLSKLAPLFYLQHEFQVENRDVNRTVPTLEGFDTQPYNTKQQEFEDCVKEYFSKKEFIELSYSEMNEVVCGLDFKKDVTFFGSQVTVENALFFDLLEICPD